MNKENLRKMIEQIIEESGYNIVNLKEKYNLLQQTLAKLGTNDISAMDDLIKDYSTRVHKNAGAGLAVVKKLESIRPNRRLPQFRSQAFHCQIFLEFVYLWLLLTYRFARKNMSSEQVELLMCLLEGRCIIPAVESDIFGLSGATKERLLRLSVHDFDKRMAEYRKYLESFPEARRDSTETLPWEFGREVARRTNGERWMVCNVVSPEMVAASMRDLDPKSFIEKLKFHLVTESADKRKKEKQIDIFEILMDAICCVMVADRKITTRERQAVHKILEKTKAPWDRDEINNRINAFIQRIKKNGLESVIQETCDKLPEFKRRGKEDVLLRCIDYMMRADREIDESELKLCQRFKSVLGVEAVAKLRSCTDLDYPSESAAVEFPQFQREVRERILAQAGGDFGKSHTLLRSLQARAIAVSLPEAIRVQGIDPIFAQEKSIGKDLKILVVTSQDRPKDAKAYIASIFPFIKAGYRFTSDTEVYFQHFAYKTWLPKELVGYFVGHQLCVLGMLFGNNQSRFSETQWKKFSDSVEFECWATNAGNKLCVSYVLKGKPTSEPWEKYRQYVDIPSDADDKEVRPNMRFQFMFESEQMSERILSSLPQKLLAALQQGKCWWRGLNPDGKFQIAWDGVQLSIGDGKELMNHVVSAGGEIYEAFLT